MKRPVDLGAVRDGRAKLAKLARDHPELRGARGRKNLDGWNATLSDEEDQEMAEKSEKTVQSAFRLPESLIARLDEAARRRTEQNPGLTFSRADVVRVLLIRALDQEEAADKPRRRSKT